MCRVHLDRHLDISLPQLKHSELAPLQAELKARIRAILYADSYDQAARLWNRLSDDRKRFANCHWHRGNSLKHLQGHFNLYMTHHKVEGLPPDTNFVENVIK